MEKIEIIFTNEPELSVIECTPAIRKRLQRAGMKVELDKGFQGKMVKFFSLSYAKIDGRKLQELYLKIKDEEIRKLILNHPDCPKELKVAEEL